MKEKITTIKREKGFNYSVDKEGNVWKEKYNWFKDPYTLVTLTIILLGLMFYLQISSMRTTETNFESSCLLYLELRDYWMMENPGKIPTLEEVFSMKKEGVHISIPNIQVNTDPETGKKTYGELDEKGELIITYD